MLQHDNDLKFTIFAIPEEPKMMIGPGDFIRGRVANAIYFGKYAQKLLVLICFPNDNNRIQFERPANAISRSWLDTGYLGCGNGRGLFTKVRSLEP